MNRSKFLAGGLLAAVFGSGIIVGNATRAFAERHRDDNRGGREQFIEWLETEMTLNPQQESAILVVLDQYNDDMHALWHQVQPQSEELVRNARAAISDILHEDQRAIYDRMNARKDSLRAERRRKYDQR